MVQGFIFEGDLQFSKLFKNTICKGVCTVKCTEKRFIPFTPPPFSSLKVPKCEILDRSDFHYFYTIKPFWVDDFVVKMLTYYFNFWGSQASFIF
jgi:hypothetical protein